MSLWDELSLTYYRKRHWSVCNMLWVTHHHLKTSLSIMHNSKTALKTALGKIAGLRDTLVIPIIFPLRHKYIWVARSIKLSHMTSLKSKQHQQCTREYSARMLLSSRKYKNWIQIIKKYIMCLTTQWKADCQIKRFHFSQPNCTCWFRKLYLTERTYEMSNADKRTCFILWWKLAWQATSASCFFTTQSSYLVCQLAESLWLLDPMKSNLKI